MPRTIKQEDLMATARKGQEIMIDAIRTWVETVRTATPNLSSVYSSFADRLPKVPSAYASRVGRLPRPEEAVANAYDLAERLLASQRKFAEDVVKATRPLMPGFGVSKPADHRETLTQTQGERTPEARGEAIPQVTAAESTPQETAPEKAPKATAAESTPRETAADKTPKATAAASTPKAAATRTSTKTTATSRTPKSTAASRAPKTTATRRAPKNSDAG